MLEHQAKGYWDISLNCLTLYFYFISFHFISFSILFLIEFIGVTLVCKTIQVSSVQLNKTLSTHCIVHPSPSPKVQSLSIPTPALPTSTCPTPLSLWPLPHCFLCLCIMSIHVFCLIPYLLSSSPKTPLLTVVSLFRVSMPLFLLTLTLLIWEEIIFCHFKATFIWYYCHSDITPKLTDERTGITFERAVRLPWWDIRCTPGYTSLDLRGTYTWGADRAVRLTTYGWYSIHGNEWVKLGGEEKRIQQWSLSNSSIPDEIEKDGLDTKKA